MNEKEVPRIEMVSGRFRHGNDGRESGNRSMYVFSALLCGEECRAEHLVNEC